MKKKALTPSDERKFSNHTIFNNTSVHEVKPDPKVLKTMQEVFDHKVATELKVKIRKIKEEVGIKPLREAEQT